MDIEQQQAVVIEQFVKQAGVLVGASLAGLLIEATSHPSLFAFSEILSVSNLSTVTP
ncbi:COP9 signalosome complex subunit 7 [Platanthera guangdongensis]|uniref:COP9 signalosome complex subunit 7 n=1 Tax=Platanthera guangdongensis TaxID=2320717 RepID=A0ABR2MN88_9ASPA